MKSRAFASLVCSVSICVAGACATNPPVDMPLANPLAEADAPGHGLGSLDKVPEYRLSAGDELAVQFGIRDELRQRYALQIRDELDIKFPTVANLDSTQMIRPDGKITLPYIGDVMAAGRSPSELMEDVRNAYKGTLRDPEVFIAVRQFDASTQELLKSVSSNDNGPQRRIEVRPDGGATFPMVGDLQVAGLTVPELATQLSAEYAKRYDRLEVDVSLNASDSARVYLLGEVRSPGAYKLNRPQAALEAVAMAGGFTQDAVAEEVVAMRLHDRNVTCRRMDLTDPLAGDKNGNMAVVEPGDVLFVPRSKITDMAYLANRLAAITFFKGYSVGFSYNLLDATKSSGAKVVNTNP